MNPKKTNISTLPELSSEKIQQSVEFIVEQAYKHTDFIVVGNVQSSKFILAGVATSTLIRYKNTDYLLTCNHVVKNNTLFFSGAKKLSEPILPDEQQSEKRRSLTLVATDKSKDIAILSGYPTNSDTKVTPYDIERSRFFNADIAKKNIGTSCGFIGVLGNHTKFGPWPDIVYAEVCYIKASAALKGICDSCLIGDFAAKEILYRDEEHFPSLKQLKAGGEINMCGCSGCGLWGIAEDSVCLMGILLGKFSGNPSTEHIIRFTPIWDILKILDSHLGKNKP